VLAADAKALDARGSVAAKARVPSPVVSVFGQLDGFQERVVGVGLSLPLPLPEPLGRRGRGDEEELRALAEGQRERAVAERLAGRRDKGAAEAELASAKSLSERFEPTRVAAARSHLHTLADEVTRGRVSVRDALIAQQALADFLLADVENRRALCVASVALAVSLGQPIEEITQ
jgi:cobalt-zinc-cadmium efflux system outer membrane protein